MSCVRENNENKNAFVKFCKYSVDFYTKKKKKINFINWYGWKSYSRYGGLAVT